MSAYLHVIQHIIYTRLPDGQDLHWYVHTIFLVITIHKGMPFVYLYYYCYMPLICVGGIAAMQQWLRL